MCIFVFPEGKKISFADKATGFNFKKGDQPKNNSCVSGGFSLSEDSEE